MPGPAALTPDAIAFLTARVPTLPARVARALFAADDPLAATRTLLNTTPAFESALYLASPSLSAALEPWRAGSTAKKKRAPLKALAYALRMSTRSTPFGLFAGAGVLAGNDPTSLRLERSSMFSSVDNGWIATLWAQLERDPQICDLLPVAANDLIVVRGERAYVRHPERLRRGADPTDRAALHYESISVRWSPTLARVLELAGREQPLGGLVAAIRDGLALDAGRARNLTLRLLEIGVLIFVRPVGSAALQRLLDVVRDAGTSIARPLEEIERRLAELDAAAPQDLTRTRLGQHAAAFTTLAKQDGSPVQINVVHHFEGSLPDCVLADVAELGSLMLAQARPRELDAYRDRFFERYEGDSRKVPLLELVDPETGLGVPEDWRPRVQHDTLRDEVRFRLIARALRERSLEVELTRAERARLLPDAQNAPPHGCEIGFQIAARSSAALQTRDYLVRPVEGANTDGIYKTSHRFAPGFGARFRERIREFARSHESAASLPAELVFTPHDAHYANLLQVPVSGFAVAGRREYLPPGVSRIEPRDIVIGLEGRRFVAYSKPLGRRLRIQESYMLQVPFFAPPHIRLLSLIGKQDHTLPRLFSWESLARSPFTPRVRSGRLVLAVARWTLFRSEVAEQKKQDLAGYLQRWREQWSVPRWVYLVERDLKMLLDLEAPIAVELIADQVTSANDGYPVGAILEFEEMFPGFDQLWLERSGELYCHEFVAGFRSAEAETGTPAPPAPLLFDAGRARRHGPGSDWTYAKLYCPASDIDTVLRTVVAPLAARHAADGSDRWFYLRYADPEPHVRVRLHAAGRGAQSLGDVAAALAPLLERGTLRRYAFDTYEPELERYGGEAALEHAETLFAHDSRRVIELLRAGALTTFESRTFHATEYLVTLMRAWFREFDSTAWMERNEKPARGARDVAWPRVRALKDAIAGSAELDPAERTAIAALGALARDNRLTAEPAALLGSFVHMHFNRIGIPIALEPGILAMLWHAWHGLDVAARHHPQPCVTSC